MLRRKQHRMCVLNTTPSFFMTKTDADVMTYPLSLRDRLALKCIYSMALIRLSALSLRRDHDVVVLNLWARQDRRPLNEDPLQLNFKPSYCIATFDVLLDSMQNMWYIPRGDATRVYLRTAEELRKEGPLVAVMIGNWVCMLTSLPNNRPRLVRSLLLEILDDCRVFDSVLWVLCDLVVSFFIKHFRWLAIPSICSVLLFRELFIPTSV